MLAEDSAVELEKRLLHLELISSPTHPPSTSTSLAELLQTALSRFNEIRNQNSTIDDFLRKYVDLQDTLGQDTNELERTALDVASIKEIVLASEDGLDRLAEQMVDLEALKEEVDSTVLKDLSRLIPTMSPLESKHIEQRKVVWGVRERYLRELDSYNSFIDSTSRLFIHYHQLLAEMEEMVSAAERAQRAA
ncbi:hypothetical protein SmJEL517_g04718 [Synchytrium microbalum]|uniref:Uncharacterized protein n=1 Tax=Synchytrium microbalum TaxID=1806994 RepID=A0A507BXJ3_9FUNG|nr:uncharacterized protein SmJEL517_g04718 [Synchytrium microbalum]TPX32152.1 hypothetical protein SmJEL517_g04718 [Synchytrium microbalum]